MGKGNQPPKRAEIQATDLPERLKEAKKNGELVYTLHHTDVRGDLDLRYCTVEVAVDIQHCDFYGVVDLRDCEFKQAVNLSHCTFHQEFNSGDEVASHTVYEKNLICDEATFVKVARFRGVRCESDALFRSTCFQYKHERADFGDANIEKSLNCDDAVFCGGVSFNTVRCGAGGSFKGTQFEKNKIEWVEFTAASFKALDCSKAEFKGPTTFNGVECTFNAVFDGAQFKCAEVVKAPQADFYLPPADFTAASFRYLNCSDVTFQGPVSFFDVECASGAWIQNTKFLGEWSAELGGIVNDFSFTNFGSNLSFYGTCFEGPVTLEQARVSKRLVLTEAEFQDSVNLYSTTIGRLVFSGLPDYPGSPPSFARRPGLDLRECSFDWFQGTKDQARKFVEQQNQAKFSRDPYVQLEKYYNISGDEFEARRIYRKGREKAREHARPVIREKTEQIDQDETEPADTRHRWNFWRYTSDIILDKLTGYGVQTWRLFLIALFFVFLGAGVFAFWPGNVLQEVEASASPAPGEMLLASTAAAGEQSSYDLERRLTPGHLVHRLAYSLDLFLPVVKLGLDERWVPIGLVPQAYAYIHVFLGWLLVPLLLASLAGIIKRQS